MPALDSLHPALLKDLDLFEAFLIQFIWFGKNGKTWNYELVFPSKIFSEMTGFFFLSCLVAEFH